MISKVIFKFENYLTQIEELVGEELEQDEVEQIVAIQQNNPTLKPEVIKLMESLGYEESNEKIKTKNKNTTFYTFVK